jgi:hypothetical protein
MKKSVVASLVCLLFSLPTFAVSESKNSMAPSWLTSRLYMGASGGYGNISGAYENDGNFAQDRLSLGLQVWQYQSILFGAELAVQSGKTMRLDASSAIIAASGGLPIQATLNPFVDLLVSAKSQLTQRLPLYGIVKGGIAFRQMQLNDRSSSKDYLQKVNGELQLGLGYKLTDHAMLTAYYQGIYSDNSAGVSIDAAGDNTYISQIPTQQAGFLGVEYTV